MTEPKPLAGRVALVTGGNRGIGAAISLALAEAGAKLAINYRRDEASAMETQKRAEALGVEARLYQASVEDVAEAESLVGAVVRDFGALDVLVNNAGIASRGNTIADTDPAEMERVLRVHALAPFYVSKFAVPHLRKSPFGGRVVMISSVAARAPAGRGAPYNMGKCAMEALALTLAREELVNGLRVNIVRPGLTVTEMGERLAKARSGVKSIHDLDATAPYGRVSTPEDVASVVRYLAATPDSYVNGQIISVDGGV